MKKLILVGCSVSSGYGWDPTNPSKDCHQAPELWINLLHKKSDYLRDVGLVNLSRGGIGNDEIFEMAISAIADQDISNAELWCQWTDLHRYGFDVGFELNPTSTGLVMSETTDINTNQFRLTKKFFSDMFDTLRAIIHPHREIKRIVRYVNHINKLCNKLELKVRHINGCCTWDTGYFNQLVGTDIKPNDYTSYTKNEILYVDNRDDDEIYQLYKKMHYEYHELGSIQESSWINLYPSLYSNRIPNDLAYDNNHPGIRSNQLFYQIIKDLID